MNWFGKIVNFLRGLFSRKTADAILGGIRKTAPYIDTAIELVQIGAAIVGGPVGRTVATVLEFAQKLGVDALLKPDATDAELGTAMRDIVVNALRVKYPEASTSDLNRAVELAVGATK